MHDQKLSLPVFSVADVKRHFTSKTFARAKGIVKSDSILRLGWDEDEGMLLGAVSGTASEPYVVSVEFDGEDGDGEFLAFCDCPVGFDCKHAAACLLKAIESREGLSGALTEAVEPSQLQQDIDTWTKRLIAGHQKTLPQENDRYREGCLVYTIDGSRGDQGAPRGAALRIYTSKLSHNGAMTKGRTYKIDTYGGYHGAEATRQDDQVIDMVRSMVMHTGSIARFEITAPYLMVGPLGNLILQQLINSNRLYLNDRRDEPLQRGQARALTVAWESGDNTSLFSLVSQVEGLDDWYPVFTDPPWYINPAGNCAGLLLTEFDASLLPMLLDAPTVPVESAQALADELSIALPAASMPLPATPSVNKVEDALVPFILVHSVDGSPDVAQWVVTCLMKYGDFYLTVDIAQHSVHTRVTDDAGAEFIIQRNHTNEYKYYQRFRYILKDFEPCHARDPSRFRIADNQPVRRDPQGRFDAFEQLFEQIPVLENEGFLVSVKPPVGVAVEQVENLSASLTGSEPGWFELGLVLEHRGARYQLMPLVIDWLERTGGDAPLRWQAEDGRWLEAPEEMLLPVVETLRELLDERGEGDTLRVPQARALTLSHLREELSDADIDVEWQDGERLFELADKLRSFASESHQSIEAAQSPEGLAMELRPYQLTGMGWLNFLFDIGLNGILADDMGLGKTAQTLAHLQALVNQTARKHKKNRSGPFLVVAPTSLLGNWAREVERFTPSLTARIWHGGDRQDRPLSEEAADIVITSYALALRDNELLIEHGFKMLILDEAQTIKNPTAKITRALKSMPIERRLCLTGTPLENHLGELWSLFDFLMPGLLGSHKRFTQHFRTPIEKHGNSSRQLRLNTVVQPFMLRRRKEEVAKELPEKTEIIQEVILGGNQAKLYESIRLAMQVRVKKLLKDRGLARSHIEMLDALLKLRQTCCHPQLVKLPAAKRVKESAKTQQVLEMIEELVAEGRKILLFSQFTEMLGLLEVELKKREIEYVKLTGRTRKRDDVIDAFQCGDVPLFLISLKAGGTGLNLTAADTVIHYDPWWNPAVERQATDRAHRIGQDKPVFVYKLVAKGTVEEKIVAMQARKQALADATVEKQDGKAISAFSADDMLALFDAD